MTDLHLPASPVLRGDSLSGNLDDSVYNRLLRERIIFLGSEVSDAVANRICAQLLLLAAEDPDRDINLWINSPGGSVTAGMGVSDTKQVLGNETGGGAAGLGGVVGQVAGWGADPGQAHHAPAHTVIVYPAARGIG